MFRFRLKENKIIFSNNTEIEVIAPISLTEKFLDTLVETKLIVSKTNLTIFLTDLEYQGYIDKQEYDYYIHKIMQISDLPTHIEIKSR